ncbi:MAG TPA: COX15/CtaA family protein [Xanthobacteraceae bacterium]|nr:COX15/CtaA family protein [Xanthobacteraceae bacterium]
MTARASDDLHTRAIRLWLYAVAALVLAMVIVGGATRLTESGLSITEWKPVMGTLPPLGEGQWQTEFEKYQAIPQYRELNRGMSLDAFKTIYWWEWTHRLLGRLIGAAFFLPFLWFLWRGWVAPALRRRLWFIFALGALQGAVGWWMVASGLADRVEVSPYRLATHLVLACAIYVVLLWTAQRMSIRSSHSLTPAGESSARIRASALGLLFLVLLQVYLGALVAGLRAGYVYNTWPLIDGAWVPESSRLFFDTPLWRNFFENALTVQFDHRALAYAIFVGALVHVLDVGGTVKKGRGLAGAIVLFAAVTLQGAIGVWTLLLRAPISVALLHQATAMLVLTVAAVHASMLASRVRRAQPLDAPAFWKTAE